MHKDLKAEGNTSQELKKGPLRKMMKTWSAASKTYVLAIP